jgi:hypothetical protein
VSVISVAGRGATRATVTVHTESERLEAEADTGVPTAELGAQRERLTRKFLALAAPVLGRPGAAALASAALDADALLDAAEVLRLARPG